MTSSMASWWNFFLHRWCHWWHHWWRHSVALSSAQNHYYFKKCPIRPAIASFSQIPRDGVTIEIRAKGKKLQYFFQFKHFSLFSNKIGANFIQTNSKISFCNDILKKNYFSIFKFCDQLLIHVKKPFFSIKIVQKLKTKKIYYINWKALPENATQWWKYLRIPLLVQAV